MFKPYSNDDDVLNLLGDAMTVSNGTTRVVLNGTLELTQRSARAEGRACIEAGGGCDRGGVAGAAGAARESERGTRREAGRRR